MHRPKILLNEFVTHDVKRFIVEKPEDYKFTPGQATEVALTKQGWEEEKRPFTFTSLNEDRVLEFTIKRYTDHDGVTKRLHELRSGDEIFLDYPWGTIQYKGPGIFIAGGAGITPFIAILRDLRNKGELKGNRLFFSNKEQKDIILEKEFKDMFPQEELVLTLTRDEHPDYEHGRFDKKFFEEHIDDFSQHFYLCGPKAMVADMKEVLAELGAKTDSIVLEE